MKPTEELIHEHEVILHVLRSASDEAIKMSNTSVIRPELVEMMLDFFRNFADKCHHAKEEAHLFTMLENRGMPKDSGPIAVMLREHTEGRRRLSNIAGLLPAARLRDEDAIRAISENLVAYVSLLENHIAKENGVLFPMADRILSEKDQEDLEKSFIKVEKEETGEGVHERYHALAHSISDYGKPA
ncbi:MAG TPA: hemerythrin domain-containing protein [Deltaproteobacteria bacterium]|nr:hemerythrin domain-containing protein [Deltaproteobacteria bacterium]